MDIRRPFSFGNDAFSKIKIVPPKITPWFVTCWDECVPKIHKPSVKQHRDSSINPPLEYDQGTWMTHKQLQRDRQTFFLHGDEFEVFTYAQLLAQQLSQNEGFLLRLSEARSPLPHHAGSLIVSEDFSKRYLGTVGKGHLEVSSWFTDSTGLSHSKPFWKNPIPQTVLLHRKDMTTVLENLVFGWTFRANTASEPKAETFQKITPPPRKRVAGSLKYTQVQPRYAFAESELIGPVLPSPEEQEMNQLRNELQSALDEIISGNQAMKEGWDEVLEDAPWYEDTLIYTGAFLTGLFNGAKGIGELLLSLGEGVITANVYVKDAIYEGIINGNLDHVQEDLEQLEEAAGETWETVSEGIHTLSMVMSDPEMRELLLDFVDDYWDSLHAVEVTELVGSASFDILLALATAGAGTAASAASKGQKLTKAGKAFQKIANALKRKRRSKSWIANNWDTLMTNGEKGVFGEAMADAWMKKNGYTKLNGPMTKIGDRPKGPGIDGIYQNSNPPPKYVIVDAKATAGNPLTSSNYPTTKGGQKQMSKRWVEARLDKEIRDKSVLNDIVLNGYKRVELKVDRHGNVVKNDIPW